MMENWLQWDSHEREEQVLSQYAFGLVDASRECNNFLNKLKKFLNFVTMKVKDGFKAFEYAQKDVSNGLLKSYGFLEQGLFP